MAAFNKVILIGNITRDVELRYSPKGMAIAKIGMAVNRKWQSETGEKKEEVTFIDVDSFGKQAEVIGQYCRKGSSLLVEGRLKLDQWDDKQTGQKRSRLGVVLESFQFIGGKREESKTLAPEPRSKVADVPSNAHGDAGAPPQDPDSEVPF